MNLLKTISSLFLIQSTIFTNSITVPIKIIDQKILISSIATFYFRIKDDITGCAPVQTLNDSLFYGGCGENNKGIQYNGEAQRYTVAIAHGNIHCNKKIKAFFEDNEIILTVKDSCIACESDDHLDMSLEALVELTGSPTIACSIGRSLPRIQWKFI